MQDLPPLRTFQALVSSQEGPFIWWLLSAKDFLGASKANLQFSSKKQASHVIKTVRSWGGGMGATVPNRTLVQIHRPDMMVLTNMYDFLTNMYERSPINLTTQNQCHRMVLVLQSISSRLQESTSDFTKDVMPLLVYISGASPPRPCRINIYTLFHTFSFSFRYWL